MANAFDEFDTAKPEADPFAEFDHSAEEYEPPKKKSSAIGKAGKMMGGAAKGLAQTGLSMATGALTSAVGGVAGGLRAAGGYLLSGESFDEAAGKGADTVRGVQGLAYAPTSREGQLISEGLVLPLEGAKWLTKKAGGAAGEVLGGEKGRIAGESIGEAAPEMALAAAPLKGAVTRASGVTPSRATEVPVAGKTYSPLRELTPEQRARSERQTAQGVKPTLASITREPEHFRFEEQTAQMPAGKALRERQMENEQAIIEAVKKVDKEKTVETKIKPAAKTEIESGLSVTNALKKKEDAAWNEVGNLYDKARQAGETKLVVSTKPLDEWLNQNRSEAISVPALATIADKIKQMKSEYNGNLTIGDMEELYKTANRLSKPGDPSSHYMGQIKGLINKVTEGQGGDLYRDARKARLKFGQEFEDQKAVADLIGTKRGYPADPKTAAEQVFQKTILSKATSLQDLQNVSRTLMTGDLKAFPEGPQAMRELQSQTINHLIEKSNVGTLDQPRLSQAAFKREIRNIGADKLNFLLGKNSVNKLNDVLRTMQETGVKPGKAVGSETFLNFKMEAQRVAKEEALHTLSSMSRFTGTVSRAFKARKEAKAIQTGVEEALLPSRAPLAQIKENAKKERALKRKYRMEEAKQALPAAAAGATSATEEKRKSRSMAEAYKL